MKLRRKIILVLVLGILLTFSPLLYLMQTKVKSTNMVRMEANTQKLVDSKSKEIGLWLNQRISEIRVIQDSQPLRTMNVEDIIPYVDRLNKSSHIKDRGAHETFAVGTVDGLGYISEDHYIDISERSYFKTVMNSDMEYIISDPVTSRSDSKLIFLISYPIRNDQQETIGFINGSVGLDKVASIAKEIDVYDGYSWIMNKDLNIYSEDAETVMSDYISKDSLQDVANQFQNQPNGLLKIKNQSSQDATVFYSSVPNAENWILCTMIDDAAINAQNNTIINIILRIGLIFILISILLAILISGSIAKPIDELSKNMKEVSNGNLDSYFKVNGNDEMNMLGVYYNQMLDDIKGLIEKVYHVEEQKRNAELKSLQAQINPHFLYNTLDTIQWKALEHDNYEVAEMINSLSGLFRISLSSGKEFIPLSEEIEHIEYYLAIQKARYEDTVQYEIVCDETIKNYKVPKLIIQPLIENAIYHGLKLNRKMGLINIHISQQEENLLISVKDNGLGIKGEKLTEIRDNLSRSIESDHYGLYNINERLRLYFNDDYTIKIISRYEVGTEVILKIPIIDEGLDV